MSDTVANRDALMNLERQVVDEISDEEPWALLEEFSELERVTGTEDEKRAAEYITERLKALNVDCERYDPELYISQSHGASVESVDRTFDSGPVKTVSFSASTTIMVPSRTSGRPDRVFSMTPRKRHRNRTAI